MQSSIAPWPKTLEPNDLVLYGVLMVMKLQKQSRDACYIEFCCLYSDESLLPVVQNILHQIIFSLSYR